MKKNRFVVGVAGLLVAGAFACSQSVAHAEPAGGRAITFHLQQAANPTEDQRDAYARISRVMTAAVARYNATTDIQKTLTVRYKPGVPTAEASYDGTISFGSDRRYMKQGTALHEIAHTLGVGQVEAWSRLCKGGKWTGPAANEKLTNIEGKASQLSCGGGHFWPYGLNYWTEWTNTPESSFENNVAIVEALREDMRL